MTKVIMFVLVMLSVSGCASIDQKDGQVGRVATKVWLPWEGQGYGRVFVRAEKQTLDVQEAAKAELKRRAIRCDRIGKAYDGESGKCVDR